MSANSPNKGPLSRYRDKRSAERTPEPFGGDTASVRGPLIFVVQKHAATRTHYDFRLQLGPVLLSWAMPKQPSLDPADKRLAVHVENHPLDYADFEGVIPEGNYGAGEVIIWDRGVWKPLEDPDQGYRDGNLKLELVGYKLRGAFALVRIVPRKAERVSGKQVHWLLIKKSDGFAASGRELAEESVLSGLTVEDLRAGRERARTIRDLLADRGAPVHPVDPRTAKLALCQVCEQPFTDADWLFELKYDGYRLIAAIRDGEPFLRYRRGHDATASFPEIAAAMRALPYDGLVIDGELVCFDERGRSDFLRLQQRAMLTRRSDVERARIELPATLMAFDLLALDDLDTRSLPLEVRKEILSQLVPRAGVVRYTEHIPEIGEAFYDKVRELDLEGMIAKRRDSPYRHGRRPEWLKIRLARVDDFAVVGYRLSEKPNRVGFSALHLAVREDGGWRYAGRVGSGFDEAELAALRARIDAMPSRRYEFDADTARDVWVEPELVAVVRYKEWPRARDHVREPTFLHLRGDKHPEDCVRPVIHGDAPLAPVAIEDEAEEREVTLTNLDKVFWPQEGYTKGDLLDYYRAISPWLMPYLRDRLLVLTRYPDGIEGKSFYQKDAPTWAPKWIRTETVWAEHSQREIHYFIADQSDALLYLANMGTIPLHVWSSRSADLAHPDWSIIDLDPKGAPFSDVVALARAIGALCEEIELPAYCKTSGSTGLHILIPLGGQCNYEQSRQLAGLISQVVVNEHPDIATMNRSIDARAGKVYLDWLQNRHGQLLVAPFSVRPLPGAPVSMPLKWSELTRRLDHTRYTIKTAPRRMKRLGDDPIVGVLEDKPDLLAALTRLAERLALDEEE